jgi:protease IV
MMENIYRQFVEKAAAGRKMKVEQLEKLAGGRVWTGKQAQAQGLVDQLGTLNDALAEAKKLAGLKPDDKIEKMTLPEPRSFLDQLFENELGVQSLLQAHAATVTPEVLRRLAEVEQIEKLFRERSLFLMPHRVEIR